VELDTIGIDPEEARVKLAEYQQALRGGRGNPEDQAIAAGYAAIAAGRPLISLQRTITAGGWHPNGLPRIAVIGAEAKECTVSWSGWSGRDLVFTDEYSAGNRGALVGAHSVRVPVPGDDVPPRERWLRGTAMVPLIPPQHRPRRLAWLRRRWILWEVEQWSRTAPRDPALLRHVRGDLWTVEAMWELTELERLVLMQRA
jgi:hypothetical protein